MSLYEFIQNLIRLSPIFIMLPSFIFLLRLQWYKRFGIMFLLGWLVFAASTLLFWSYSINNAPNEEIMIDLAQRDGASRVFGTLFGWAFGLVLLFIFELSRLFYLGLISTINKLKK